MDNGQRKSSENVYRLYTIVVPCQELMQWENNVLKSVRENFINTDAYKNELKLVQHGI